MGIFVLDYIHDLDSTGKVADRCIKSVMHSLAILIGFSWEHCFHSGISSVVHSFSNGGFWYPRFMKLGLGMCVAAVIVPAWRLYILRSVMKFDKEMIPAASYAASSYT